MYVLYLDESGTHSDARQCEVAGIGMYEHNAYWVTDGLNQLGAEGGFYRRYQAGAAGLIGGQSYDYCQR